MRTVVFQSYRVTDVAPWISQCMDTVRAWAAHKGYGYVFYGDEFFDRLPEWFKERVGHQILPMSDLARLVVAGELLDQVFERTIWVDADVLSEVRFSGRAS